MKHLVAIATFAGALGVSGLASAQDTLIVRDPATVGSAVSDVTGIPADRVRSFRQYVIEEEVPDFTMQSDIAVGAEMPEVGVTYYDVPDRFGAARVRYTMVNGRTILVEPRSRRIIQVID